MFEKSVSIAISPVIFFLFLFFAGIGHADYKLVYRFFIDGKTSGFPFASPTSLNVTDNELYIIDSANFRLVITDYAGIFLYTSKYTDAGIKSTSPQAIAVDKKTGDIYISEGTRVVIMNYRGIYRKDLDLSGIPDSGSINIKSIAFDEQGRTYLGDNKNSRIIVLDKDKKFLFQFGQRGYGPGRFLDVTGIHVDEKNVYFLDIGNASVFVFDREGKFVRNFGRLSSLAGGFSMPADMTMDSMGHIVVIDANRAAVILFDKEGNFIFEFGGTDLFYLPRAVAAGKNGYIYMTDGTSMVRAFQIIEEAPPVAAVQPEPVPPPPPPAPEPPKEEVAKMVEEEARLLPVFFDVDSAKLKQADFTILDKDAEWLKKNPDAKINVRGYADERGSDALNLKLSKARAKVVMDYLVKQGIDQKRLKFIGFGRVISTDKSEEAMRQNRRVDFLVVEEIEPAAAPAIVTGITTAAKLSVRQGPDKTFKAMTSLPKNTKLTVVGRNSDSSWLQIQIPETTGLGWVSKDFVNVQGDINSLPVAETTESSVE